MQLPSYERMRTIALLHRFFRTALLMGRMPSLLGREVFRARTTHQPAQAFENSLVFVCDVERCLASLEQADQRLIAMCVFEDWSEWEAARRCGQPQADVSRRLAYALDLLHDVFCRLGLLRPMATELGETEEVWRQRLLKRARRDENEEDREEVDEQKERKPQGPKQKAKQGNAER